MPRPPFQYASTASLIDDDKLIEVAANVETLNTEVQNRNATIEYQESGVPVGTKGGIQYLNFTGSAALSAAGDVLTVDITGGGGGLSQPQILARNLGC